MPASLNGGRFARLRTLRQECTTVAADIERLFDGRPLTQREPPPERKAAKKRETKAVAYDPARDALLRALLGIETNE